MGDDVGSMEKLNPLAARPPPLQALRVAAHSIVWLVKALCVAPFALNSIVWHPSTHRHRSTAGVLLLLLLLHALEP